MLKGRQLRRVAHALVDVVCEEFIRNPEFADRLESVLRDVYADTLSTEDRPTRPKKPKKQQLVDPFQVLSDRGALGLRAFLQAVSIQDLKGIVRAHRLDPSRLSDKWRSQERLVDFVTERVESRARQGDVFRQYGARQSGAHTPTTGEQVAGANLSKPKDKKDQGPENF